MVKPTDTRESDDLPEFLRRDRARDRHIAIQAHVRAVLVVVGGVLADQANEVARTKHDHVLEQLSAQDAHPPFRVPALRRRSGRAAQLFDAKVSYSRVEARSVDAITVADGPDNIGIGADYLDVLLVLGGPRRGVRRQRRGARR